MKLPMNIHMNSYEYEAYEYSYEFAALWWDGIWTSKWQSVNFLGAWSNVKEDSE